MRTERLQPSRRRTIHVDRSKKELVHGIETTRERDRDKDRDRDREQASARARARTRGSKREGGRKGGMEERRKGGRERQGERERETYIYIYIYRRNLQYAPHLSRAVDKELW